MAEGELPPGWVEWDRLEGDHLVLVFRPDVFDSDAFPAACLPTIYVREGERDPRRAGPDPQPGTEGLFTVTLFLEPAVEDVIATEPQWTDAVEAARETAGAFAAGDIDPRSLYQEPRSGYLDRLEELQADSP